MVAMSATNSPILPYEMAKHEVEYSCDGCGKYFPSGADVRGSVSVYSSDHSFLLGDVCDSCSNRIEGILIAKLPEPNPTYHSNVRSLPPAPRFCSDQEGVCEPDKCTCQ